MSAMIHDTLYVYGEH